MDVAKSQFPVTWGFIGARACYSASTQSPTAPFWKPNVLGELQESVLFDMTDKSLRVKLVIVSLLEHTLNQQISHFRSIYSTRKVNIDESFVSSTFETWHSPTKRQVVGLFYHCNFVEILFASMYLGKDYMKPPFCKWPSPGLNKQSWCWKKFCLINILTQWFPNWGKLPPGVICDSSGVTQNQNHIVVQYYER